MCLYDCHGEQLSWNTQNEMLVTITFTACMSVSFVKFKLGHGEFLKRFYYLWARELLGNNLGKFSLCFLEY